MVTMKQPNSNEEKFIRILEKGDFFGEKALQGYVVFLLLFYIFTDISNSNKILQICFRDDLRTANIICDSPEGVTCLVIDRETFNQLISSLDEIRTKYKDEGDSRRRYLFISYFSLFKSIVRIIKK